MFANWPAAISVTLAELRFQELDLVVADTLGHMVLSSSRQEVTHAPTTFEKRDWSAFLEVARTVVATNQERVLTLRYASGALVNRVTLTTRMAHDARDAHVVVATRRRSVALLLRGAAARRRPTG